jgi:hypothetical protein
MSIRGRFLSRCFARLVFSIAMLVVGSAASFAQSKPIPIEAASSAAAASKAQSVINKPGSYVLNKNITNTSKNGQDSLDITVSNVTVDLQGFVISATGSNTGVAINATGQSNVIIRNGIITGFDGAAIVLGNNGNVSAITATQNGSGITCGSGCLVSNSILQGNLGLGLTFSDTTSGYLGNILQGNNGNNVGNTGQVSGGTSLNQNVCNGAAC